MIDFIGRIFRFLALALVAFIGLGMALIFTFSTIIAVAILFLVARLRGQRFSVQEYWTNRKAQRKPIFTKGNTVSNERTRENVTDVEARDIR
ncbi:MAG: hypothetical protein WAO93_09075 [Orrella sp.]|jgi:hypothetical protein|uniref:hypothetical protein n=1 Tax=Orrella sp. TaxID=1921583 RepID=UPI003BC50C28